MTFEVFLIFCCYLKLNFSFKKILPRNFFKYYSQISISLKFCAAFYVCMCSCVLFWKSSKLSLFIKYQYNLLKTKIHLLTRWNVLDCALLSFFTVTRVSCWAPVSGCEVSPSNCSTACPSAGQGCLTVATPFESQCSYVNFRWVFAYRKEFSFEESVHIFVYLGIFQVLYV